jgi:type IV pilus assembly protein PilM
MIFSKLFGAETVVGIDIGSRSIKVVHASLTTHNHWNVAKAASMPTPAGALKDGIVVDRGAVADAIVELLDRAGLSRVSGAVCAVSGQGIIVRHIQLPMMSEEMLRKSIRYEAAKYISASVDDSCIEFEILGPSVSSPNQMSVMLVAAPMEMVNSRTDAIEKAGIEPVAMELDAFAIQRSLIDVSQSMPDEGASIALLSIGASTSELTIVTGGCQALSRSIGTAGDQFTNAIVSQNKCTWDEAETSKRGIDLNALFDKDAPEEQILMARAVQPALDEILREVRRSVNFFRSQVNEGGLVLPASAFERIDPSQQGGLGAVSRLVVTGGSSAMKGLDRYMPARLGMPVEVWNAFKNSVFDTSDIAPSILEIQHGQYAQCLGLAIKETICESAPDETKRSKKAA